MRLFFKFASIPSFAIIFLTLGNAHSSRSSSVSNSRHFQFDEFVIQNCDKATGACEEVRITRFIAKGGGATKVYSGIYKNELVAVKRVVIKELSRLKKDSERLQTYSELEHENLAKFKRHFYKDCALWIVMEYVHGINLRVLKNRYLQSPTVNYIMTSLLSAVTFLHSRGIIHRDIKDENVMITRDGQVKLIDFDLIFKVVNNVYPSVPVGSWQYMAPEVFKLATNHNFNDPYSFKADIWSCGILFYRLALGMVPGTLAFPSSEREFPDWKKRVSEFFTSNSQMEGSMWSFGPNVDFNWNLLLNKMLTWDPNRRADSDILFHEFQGLSGESNTEITKNRIASICESLM